MAESSLKGINGTYSIPAIKSFDVAEGYPIVLDLKDRLIVVVGGGGVALRKVQGLLAASATRIRIIAPAFHPEMPSVASIERISLAYQSEHLAGASLVFAATDSPKVNDQVVQDAHRIHALVCRADVYEENAGDFHTPAMLRDGELLVTISSGGSPALSALIRDRLHAAIDPNWPKMAGAMKTIRPILKKQLSPQRRKEAFHELCSDPAMETLAKQGVEGLNRWLAQKYPELNLHPPSETPI